MAEVVQIYKTLIQYYRPISILTVIYILFKTLCMRFCYDILELIPYCRGSNMHLYQIYLYITCYIITHGSEPLRDE